MPIKPIPDALKWSGGESPTNNGRQSLIENENPIDPRLLLQTLTFLQDKATRMVEEKVPEVVAVGINSRLLAETGRPEEGKRL